MAPHAPYLLTENCLVSGRFDAGYYLATRYAAPERTDRRRQYYESYFAQVRCVQQKVARLLTAIGESERHRDALIVIHGDHGSRISSGNVLEDYSERDFVDNYGAFFAVRSPAIEPGLDCEFVSLSEVFRRHVARTSPVRHLEAPRPVLVLSRAAGNVKVEAPMPLFGCAAESPLRLDEP